MRHRYILQELLAFVPQPVYAVLLLFPVTEQLDKEAAKGKPLTLMPTSLCLLHFFLNSQSR